MFKVLRIVCCIIAALCVAACVFVFIYAGAVWGICTLLGAVVFFALTVLFKRYQEDEEARQSNDGQELRTAEEQPTDEVQPTNGQEPTSAESEKPENK